MRTVHLLPPIFVFALGLAFGSFLNVCIYRVPLAIPEEIAGESALRSMLASIGAWRAVNMPARSFCPRCEHPIRWYDNLPVLSWLLLRGRCRDCGAGISFRYAAVELLTATLFLASWARFGLTVEALKYCVFSFLLVGLIFTDAEHRILPDAFTIPGLLVGLGFSILVPVRDLAGRLASIMVNEPMPEPLLSLGDALLGAAVGAGFIFASGLMYRIARGHEGMGRGDVKLMGMIGAFLGFKLALLTIFGAAILGAVFGGAMFPLVWIKRLRRRIACNREHGAVALRRAWISAKLVRYYAIPFGVFLGSVALLAVFFGNPVLEKYWDLMQDFQFRT